MHFRTHVVGHLKLLEHPGGTPYIRMIGMTVVFYRG